jgi:hypothetical protein
MRYLDAAEYVSFGLGEETGDSLVVAASALIDAFCRRASLGVTQYLECLRFRRGGNTVQLSYAPLIAAVEGTSPIVSARVRLGRLRAEECHPMESAAAVFAPAGSWSSVDPAALEVSTSGSVSFSPHLLGMPFYEAEVTYMAGYAEMPVAVKVACAQIVRNAQAMPALNVKRQALDSMQMEYFSGALLDDDVKRLLQPYVAGRMG